MLVSLIVGTVAVAAEPAAVREPKGTMLGVVGGVLNASPSGDVGGNIPLNWYSRRKETRKLGVGGGGGGCLQPLGDWKTNASGQPENKRASRYKHKSHKSRVQCRSRVHVSNPQPATRNPQPATGRLQQLPCAYCYSTVICMAQRCPTLTRTSRQSIASY